MSIKSKWHDARVVAGYAAMPGALLGANMGANYAIDTDAHFSEIAPVNAGVVGGQIAVLAVGAAFERWGDKLPSKIQPEAVRRGLARVAATAMGGVMGALEAARRDGRWISGTVQGAAAGYATARVTPSLVPDWGRPNPEASTASTAPEPTPAREPARV